MRDNVYRWCGQVLPTPLNFFHGSFLKGEMRVTREVLHFVSDRIFERVPPHGLALAWRSNCDQGVCVVFFLDALKPILGGLLC